MLRRAANDVLRNDVLASLEMMLRYAQTDSDFGLLTTVDLRL